MKRIRARECVVYLEGEWYKPESGLHVYENTNIKITEAQDKRRDDNAEQRHAQDDKEADVLLRRRRMGDLHDDSVPNMADPGAGMEKKEGWG